MMVRLLLLAGAAVVTTAAVAAQDRRIEPAEVRCPTVLGVGLNTDLAFCDVLIQQDADLGVVVIVPPHRGEATLSFNLHNRHTYSAEEERSGRAYAEYTAEIAVATVDGDVVGRRFILSEFRTADDLIDRVTGGAGPGGMKAVAPTGVERVFVAVPDDLEVVSIVGQNLEVVRLDGRESIRSIGRPVAVISDVRVEYREP